MISTSFKNSLQIERSADSLASSKLLQGTTPKSLESNGVAITNLVISNVKSKLNRWELELALDPAFNLPDAKMNNGNIKSGDIVGVGPFPQKIQQDFNVNGVVSTITGTKCIIDVGIGNQSIMEKTTQMVSQAGDRSGSTNSTSDFPLTINQRVWILKLMNETPYKRMDQAMNKLQVAEQQAEASFGVIDVLLGIRSPISTKMNFTSTINPNLNKSQIDAINYALNSELAIIHGPPGTGKTRTVVEFILTSLKLNPNKRILVTAGSNVAVDTILERLIPYKDLLKPNEIVRVGHPAKMLNSKSTTSNDGNDKNEMNNLGKKVKAIKLKKERKEKRSAKKENRKPTSQINIDKMSPLEYRAHLLNTTHLQYILHSNFKPILQSITEDLKSLETQLDKPGTRYSERRDLYRQIRDLQMEKRTREHSALMEVLRAAKVIIGTVVGIGANDIFFGIKDLVKESPQANFFETLIIDEVSQTLEPACWIPILAYAPNKIVLAGDNKQLAPTIHCSDSDLLPNPTKDQNLARDTLVQTLFDRLISIHSGNLEFVKFLNIQYRMNELIQKFSSDEFYKGELKPDDSVKDHTLLDLLEDDEKTIEEADEDLSPLIWQDTCGLHGEFTDIESGSKYNIGECHLAKEHIAKLVKLGVKEDSIGVIAPYSAQVSKLRDIIWNRNDDSPNEASFPNVEISTVDGFQGREKEVIILTLVRSNDEKEVGFLKDFKRLNVSITRSKRQLYVIGDFITMNECDCKVLNDWSNFMNFNSVIKYVEN